ncbi:YheT family hydrolase [Urechidicola vernalis]|uniref:Alpha/beta fold hydrolase n=1 Tax=Urechidicola vernalis TaxID=3075600 RepID=A0ABU2Y5A8_9FLAO|nr:alpha/beta fold hydrolase [Urechidicola sp. P050]MDT0552253.1 alpha/beta fold hydrolase [Urechidicola sp. P050]
MNYKRERLELADGDFMDLDYSKNGSETIVIALHGLEGSSSSRYILSMVEHLKQQKIDVVAVNFRGCSGHDNRLFSSYHSGKSEDLEAVIHYIEKQQQYKNILLLGYSLGGNMTLKYLGEKGRDIPPQIKCAIAISPPCDLASSSAELAKKSNYIYMQRFLKTLKSKTLSKLETYPTSILTKETIESAKNFYDYDNLYTAPAHGFKNAEDYWQKASSKQFLNNISVPTLLISSYDDTFLSHACIPSEIAQNHEFLNLEATKFGGHVGYNSKLTNKNGNWLEKRIIQFLKKNTSQ